MIHAEVFETRSEATKAEAAFKKLSRKQKEIYLKNNPSLSVLDEKSVSSVH
jgi:putative endonuclease